MHLNEISYVNCLNIMKGKVIMISVAQQVINKTGEHKVCSLCFSGGTVEDERYLP